MDYLRVKMNHQIAAKKINKMIETNRLVIDIMKDQLMAIMKKSMIVETTVKMMVETMDYLRVNMKKHGQSHSKIF